MGIPDGAHDHGHGNGSGAGTAVLVVLAAAAAAAVLPAVLAVVRVLLIAAAVILGVAAAALVAVIAWRRRRAAPVPPWQPGTLNAAHRAAVAPREVHLHLHGATAEDIAQALAQLPATPAQPPGWAPHNQPTARKDQP